MLIPVNIATVRLVIAPRQIVAQFHAVCAHLCVLFFAEEEGSPEEGSPREGEGPAEGEGDEGEGEGGEQEGEVEGAQPPAPHDADHDIEHSIPATLIQDPNADR